jgi:hypothetical protein
VNQPIGGPSKVVMYSLTITLLRKVVNEESRMTIRQMERSSRQGGALPQFLVVVSLTISLATTHHPLDAFESAYAIVEPGIGKRSFWQSSTVDHCLTLARLSSR